MLAKGVLAAIAAMLLLTVPVHAETEPVTVITDPAGDGNGLDGVTASPVTVSFTGPVSDGPRDITGVAVSRDADELIVRMSLVAAPEDLPPATVYTFTAQVGTCELGFAAGFGNVDSASGEQSPPVAALHGDGCKSPGYYGSGYPIAVEGATIVTRFPFAEIARHGFPAGPGAVLGNLRADSVRGRYLLVGTIGSPAPGVPGLPGFEGYVGAVIDAGSGAGTYEIPLEAE